MRILATSLTVLLAAATLVACGETSPTDDEPPAEQPGDDVPDPDDGDDGAGDEPGPDDGFGDDFDRDVAEREAGALLGLTESEVPEDPETRIVRRGDEDLPGTMDLRPGRRNVELDEIDGTMTVTRVVVEVPDGDPIVVELDR